MCIRKNILRPDGRFRPMRLVRLDGRALPFCTKDAHPLEESTLSSPTNYPSSLANLSTLPAYSSSTSCHLPMGVESPSLYVPGLFINKLGVSGYFSIPLPILNAYHHKPWVLGYFPKPLPILKVCKNDLLLQWIIWIRPAYLVEVRIHKLRSVHL